MNDASCDVIRDLLPLYVDDVASAESRRLVEEHVGHCPACEAQLRSLREDEATRPSSQANERAALQKIRHGIASRGLRAALVSALCVIALVATAYYLLFVRETYLPYEQSGLVVVGDELRTDAPFYASRGAYSRDGRELFLYMTTTAHTSMSQERRQVCVEDLSPEARTMHISDGESLVNTQIYYVPEEYVRRFHLGERPLTDDEVAQLKEASVLVWEAA